MHKSRRIYLLSLFILLPFVLQAQIHVNWSRTIEEVYVSRNLNAVAAHDGGYLIVNTFGTLQYNVMKIDTAGNVEWYKSYDFLIWNLVQAPDSGYVLLGENRSQEWGGSFVVELIRTDNSGNIIWSRTYGDSTDNEARSICMTDDGGYAVATESSIRGYWVQDIWLLRLNSMGDTLWTRRYDINNNSMDYIMFFRSLSQTDDGGFILTGFADHYSDGDMFLLKTTASGDIEWVNTYGEENNDEVGYTLRVLDSGYLLGGDYGSQTGCLINVDQSGNTVWKQVYNTFNFNGITIQPITVPGGWILVGTTEMFTNSYDAYIMEIDTNGVIQWEATIGTDSTDEYGGPIFPVGDNKYIMAGAKKRVHDLFYHLWITQFTVDSTTGTVANPRLPFPESVHLFENYPNPFNPATTITYELPAGEWQVWLSVYDLSGRLVRTLVQSAESGGVYRAEWDGRDQKGNPVASGVYLSHLTVESPAEGAISTKTQKMILLR